MKRIISNLVVAIIAFIIYYFTLPAFNLQSMGFYSYLPFISDIVKGNTRN